MDPILDRIRRLALVARLSLAAERSARILAWSIAALLAAILLDAAGTPLEVELGEDPAIVDRPGEVVFCVLHAAGPDGLRGTRDDRAFTFRGDGSMGEARPGR